MNHASTGHAAWTRAALRARAAFAPWARIILTPWARIILAPWTWPAFALALPIALGVLLAAGPARAQAAPAPRPAASSPLTEGQEPADVAPDSPRAAVRTFLDLTHRRRDAEAALWLEAPLSTGPEAATRARHLQTVLERELSLDLDAISPDSAGKTKDDLPLGVEEIGILTSGPTHDPVRLVVRMVGSQRRWVFSRTTIERTEARYGRLKSSWLEERLPQAWLGAGPWELRWWQWVALPLLVLASAVLGRLLAAITRWVLMRVVAHTTNAIDDELVGRSTGPFTLGWAVITCLVALPWLDLRAGAHRGVERLLTALFILALFWALLRSLDVLKDALLRAPRTAAHPSAVGLIDIGTRLSKLLVVAMGVTIAVSQFGYSVSGLVTGLGIGGLAVALAFQKTGENLFGSIALGVDQPFRVGDFVRVDGIEGTVEAIGLRSTRLRTLDRTLVTIPNGKLADMKIESLAARDRLRLHCIVSLVYETTPAQLRQVLDGLEAVLRAHPQIWPDVVVHFSALGNASLDIEVMAWFQTQTPAEFKVYRQEVLLGFLAVVKEAGTNFAFPTQTLHLTGDRGAPLVVQRLDGPGPARRTTDAPGPHLDRHHDGLGPASARSSQA